MTTGFVWAIAILCLPTLVLAGGVAGCLREHDDATRALSLPFAYACVVVCGVLAVRLGVRGQALTLVTVGPALLAGAYLLYRRGPRSLPLWPLAGAGITLAILASPYRWDKPGVLGWNVGNDSVVHATYAEALGMPDRAPVAGSSARLVVDSFANGYPEGSHALFAAVLAFSRDPLTSFNPVLAVMMAFAAFPAYWLIRRQLASAPLAGIGAAGAAGGYLQFGFYSQGFMPQLALTALLFGALGLGYEAIASASLVLAGMAGVTAAGAVIMYSAAVGVYLAPAAVLALIALAVVPGLSLRTRVLLPAVALAAGALAILPELTRTLRLGRAAAAAAGDPAAFVSDRGNLPGPVDKLTVLGAWIGPDYRVPYIYIRPTHAAMVAAAVLAGAAVLVALRRRRLALPAILVAVAAGAVYVAASSSIYYTAKTYQVAAFPIACAVVAGAAALTRCPWSPQLAVPVAAAGALLLGGLPQPWSSASARPRARPRSRLPSSASSRRSDVTRLTASGSPSCTTTGRRCCCRTRRCPTTAASARTFVPGYGFAGHHRHGLDRAGLPPAASTGSSSRGSAGHPSRRLPSGPREGSAAYRFWSRADGIGRDGGRDLPLERHDALGGLTLAPGASLVAPRSRPARGSRRRRHALVPGALEAARLGLGAMGRQAQLRRAVSGRRPSGTARRSRSEWPACTRCR